MIANLIVANTSAATQAAAEFLSHLGIKDPPLTVGQILDGLGVSTQPLPKFDLERMTPEQRRQFQSMKAIRGLLSPAERVIYVSNNIRTRQYPWLICHESGHALITWHREALYLDDDYRLSQRAIELMEKEANEFAEHLLFLGPRFTREARELTFGLDSAKILADRYGASYESAIHHYVKNRSENCICLVFQLMTPPTPHRVLTTSRTLRYRYFIRSRFRGGKWNIDYSNKETLSLHDPLVRLLNDGFNDGESVHDDIICDQDSKGCYLRQVFSNGHSVFVLLSIL